MIGVWIRANTGAGVLIDRLDQDLADYKWYVGRKGDFLAFPRRNGVNHLSLHRVICTRVHGDGGNKLADHVNRDRTDNRRQNLRWLTMTQSNWNRGPSRKNVVGYKGVYIQKNCTRKRFGALIEVDGKSIHLGGYTTAEAAARAYDDAARSFVGEFAYVNFPDGP